MNDLNWERFKSHLDAGLAGLRAELIKELGELRVELRTEQNKLLRWMLICFSSFFVGLAGLVIGLATILNSH